MKEDFVITFDNLPLAISMLLGKVSHLEQLVEQANRTSAESDNWLNVEGLCDYHPEKPAKQTVYSWVSNKIIPFHKRGKKLIFLKSEIDIWLKQGRKKTISEIQAEAQTFIKSKNKKG